MYKSSLSPLENMFPIQFTFLRVSNREYITTVEKEEHVPLQNNFMPNLAESLGA